MSSQEQDQEQEQEQVEFESKLIPILREGVDMVKMIIFMQLRKSLTTSNPDWQRDYSNKITGAVVNELFCLDNTDPEFLKFVEQNHTQVESGLACFCKDQQELFIPLTDALRIMVLCDHQEGVDRSSILQRAGDLGVLLLDRPMAMPNKFIELVRRLGTSFGLLNPLASDSAGQ